jgi:thiamine transporter ThiT
LAFQRGHDRGAIGGVLYGLLMVATDDVAIAVLCPHLVGCELTGKI